MSLPIIQKAVSITGVKPAANRVYDLIRIIILVGLILFIIYQIDNDNQDTCTLTLDDLSDKVKPGTILYQTIDEMDDDLKSKYIKNIQVVFEDDESIVDKYKKNIKNSIIAGVLSEFIVNGNLNKPMGIISKTLLYSVLNTNLAA